MATTMSCESLDEHTLTRLGRNFKQIYSPCFRYGALRPSGVLWESIQSGHLPGRVHEPWPRPEAVDPIICSPGLAPDADVQLDRGTMTMRFRDCSGSCNAARLGKQLRVSICISWRSARARLKDPTRDSGMKMVGPCSLSK